MAQGTQVQTEENFENTQSSIADGDGSNGQMQRNFSPDDYYTELKYRSVKDVGNDKLAGGLGIFSIALGLAELLAPEQLGEMIGLDKKRRALLPFFGLREIASGIAIMKMKRPAGAVWSRVGGDAMDLTFLASAYASGETDKMKLTMATAAVLGVTALDVICAQKLSQKLDESEKNPEAPTTVGQSSGRHSANE